MQVSKWGNSLAVRLPRALVERLKLRPGDTLEVVAADEQRIAVEKVSRREEALARMAGRAWEAPEGYRFDRDDANAR
jgi:antitoxin MazE